jgi:hypothetical protein
MSQSNLTLKSKEIIQFLTSLSKLSDSSILEVTSDEIYSIAASDDRSMFLWSTLSGDFEFETTLNLPSLTKLSDLLKMVGDDVTFKVLSNKLSYKGNGVKFDYHLYDEGILNKPKVTLKKIKSLTYDYEFSFTKSYLRQTILKNSSILKDTNKLYIYTEDDHLVWNLGDRTKTNTDNLTIIGDKVDFEMDEFIMNLDNLRLVEFGSSEVAKFEVSKNGIGKISIDSDPLQLNYIISSLTK